MRPSLREKGSERAGFPEPGDTGLCHPGESPALVPWSSWAKERREIGLSVAHRVAVVGVLLRERDRDIDGERGARAERS